MKVVLSSGLGPLHFVSSARFISKKVHSLRFLCGYIPSQNAAFLMRIVSFLRGKKIDGAIKKRKIDCEAVDVHSCLFSECFNQFLMIVNRIVKGIYKKCYRIAWSFFGWESCFYLQKVDVFHVRSGSGQGGAIKKAKRLGMKVIVDHSALHPAQSYENLENEFIKWGGKPTINPNAGVWVNVLRDCKDADMIVVNAEHIKDSFIKYGYPKEKLRVVYLGVRSDFQGLKENYTVNGDFRVLFTGGFILLKGAEYILESLRILHSRGVPVHYDIVGQVSAPSLLLNKYKDLNITFHGQVPQDELKTFLHDADCYLFPSLADGCAQSGMEALSAGLPVVATYQSGLPITDGESGCVVPMKDAEAIANKIEWLIAHPEERESLGRNAAKMMREKYTWEKYAENMVKVYEEMV